MDLSGRMSRRDAITAGASLLTAATLNGTASANAAKTLNIACIGIGGRMETLYREAIGGLGQNLVAMCDVDPNQMTAAVRNTGSLLKNAVQYSDYRKLLAHEKSIDAVIVATPDHWHAPICAAAIRAGKHVYCEKPLAHTVAEARMLRTLSKRSKVITQTGNQGSASDNMRRCVEVIQRGLVGQIHEVHIWHPTHSWPSGVDRPAGSDTPPPGMNWDFWLGTSPERPFKAENYHPALWRGWYDFGSGSLGDFCCHAFNLPVRALGLNYPHRIEVSGATPGSESFPAACSLRFHFAGKGKRAPVVISFYTGGELPPAEATRDLAATYGSVPGLGCLLIGDKGVISAGLWNSDGLIKLKGDIGFTGVLDHDGAKKVPKTLPRSICSRWSSPWPVICASSSA